jgi:hypothetical protein
MPSPDFQKAMFGIDLGGANSIQKSPRPGSKKALELHIATLEVSMKCFRTKITVLEQDHARHILELNLNHSRQVRDYTCKVADKLLDIMGDASKEGKFPRS